MHHCVPNVQPTAWYRSTPSSNRFVPAASSARVINDLPLTANRDSDEFTIEGRAPREESASTGIAQDRLITPDYFRATNIPLVEGRTFTRADASSAPPVVIIGQSFAHRFFPNGDPVGRRLTFGATTAASWSTIVRIVGDVRDLGLDAQPDMDICAPYQQSTLPYNPLPYMTLVIGTVGDPNKLTSTVLTRIHEVAKDLPLPKAEPMEGVYVASILQRRFNMLLLSIFAGIAQLWPAWGFTALFRI